MLLLSTSCTDGCWQASDSRYEIARYTTQRKSTRAHAQARKVNIRRSTATRARADQRLVPTVEADAALALHHKPLCYAALEPCSKTTTIAKERDLAALSPTMTVGLCEVTRRSATSVQSCRCIFPGSCGGHGGGRGVRIFPCMSFFICSSATSGPISIY